MPVSKVLSFAISGIDAFYVTVEVDTRKGIPGYTTVGLPDKAVAESKNRVTAALKNSGFTLPSKKITVNLAPADIKKEGSSFDFPIALGILSSFNVIPQTALEGYSFAGELSLDGSLRRVKGTLPMAMLIKKSGGGKLMLPEENSKEGALVPKAEVYPVKDLKSAVLHILKESVITPLKWSIPSDDAEYFHNDLDFSEVKGQEFAKRAFEIAAAGGHNIILKGPPGAGKTMLSRRMVSILPPLSVEEALEVSRINSVTGEMRRPLLSRIRPFRAPHHTISDAALIGGGSIPRPGEVTLAHRGVLFLDEFPEFKRSVVEVLRQPLEEGYISIARASEKVTFPASFMLIAAMNPCPCGYSGSSEKECVCSFSRIQSYTARVSGPILDRIDMHIELPPVKSSRISSAPDGERSSLIRERVIMARNIQQKRYARIRRVHANSDLRGKKIEEYCVPDAAAASLLKGAVDKYSLSARGYSKVLKLSRTIADLGGSDIINEIAAAEALQYRLPLDN